MLAHGFNLLFSGYNVTQEDLDNVINLLSGCPPISHSINHSKQPAIPPYHMMNAPPPMLHPPCNLHTPPPSHITTSLPLTMSGHTLPVSAEPNRKYLQRKPDTVLARKASPTKTNTWPNPGRQKTPQSLEELYNTDPEYAHFLAVNQCIAPTQYLTEGVGTEAANSMMGGWPGYASTIPNGPWENNVVDRLVSTFIFIKYSVFSETKLNGRS